MSFRLAIECLDERKLPNATVSIPAPTLVQVQADLTAHPNAGVENIVLTLIASGIDGLPIDLTVAQVSQLAAAVEPFDAATATVLWAAADQTPTSPAQPPAVPPPPPTGGLGGVVGGLVSVRVTELQGQIRGLIDYINNLKKLWVETATALSVVRTNLLHAREGLQQVTAELEAELNKANPNAAAVDNLRQAQVRQQEWIEELERQEFNIWGNFDNIQNECWAAIGALDELAQEYQTLTGQTYPGLPTTSPTYPDFDQPYVPGVTDFEKLWT